MDSSLKRCTWRPRSYRAPNLPPLADMHHYQMYLAGYNAADEMLGRYEYSFFVPGAIGYGSGSDYRFKVCASWGGRTSTGIAK